ncbi:transcriptional regulator, TetR family [Nocardioides terrae]|uniref:Transcriptional regulator, TetR family n=1 Tax=Nocardioides terrae TaxID=574651 RepID=A0A1I1KI74_9ACTN|nr:TetR/AcrR family transcriptional regulator [Nocardioides terrae]SFC57823.1 transcriptional regulator, TetR family [Nocardioides terrae]
MHSQPDRALRQLWGLDAPAVRGPKARWSPEQLAAAAVELADRHGLEGISLAKVAERVGMTTTAVYRYVDSKAALVELMVDGAIGDPPRITGRDWRQRCRSWASLLADRYAEHPWLCHVTPRRMPTQPRAYAWIDALVGAIADQAGVDALRVALLLDSLVRTYAALEVGLRDAIPAPWLDQAVAERYPRLAATAGQDVSDARGELTFAVDTVLRGLG